MLVPEYGVVSSHEMPEAAAGKTVSREIRFANPVAPLSELPPSTSGNTVIASVPETLFIFPEFKSSAELEA